MISLIAASVREQLYQSIFDSLKEETAEIEAVFAGHTPPKGQWPELRYIETAKIKPAQAYDICRREAKGEVVVWTADDAEYKGGILTKAYEYWKSQNNKKLILSIQTREFYLDRGNGFCDMTKHAFFGGRPETPLMAPLAMISREYFNELGGVDRRYICGQWENDVLMRAYADGAKVEIFGDKDAYIEIDHVGKFEKITGQKGYNAHNKRPFASGYLHDRKILEGSWTGPGIFNVLKERCDNFEPFEESDLLVKSQSHAGIWE